MMFKVVPVFESVCKILNWTFQMKTTEQLLSGDTVHYAVQGGSYFQSVNKILINITIQVKAIEQYSPVILFIVLYKMVLTFK